MPKKKGHKGIAKRFKVTAKGKVLASKPGYHHKLIKKRAKNKRKARRGIELVGRERRKILERMR
jgi:large subunit ribosomal protein L35